MTPPPAPSEPSATPGAAESGGHVVIACDKFKGSLTAHEVVAAITAGLRDALPRRQVRSVIVADGGDGTLDSALTAGYTRVPVTVDGPTGEPVQTAYARHGAVALVEMADACGLIRLPGGHTAALTASSRGVGQALAAALDAGATELVLGIGGSASTDGGAGMLQALGARLLDAAGEPIGPGGAALADLATVDLEGLHPGLARASLTVACDVNNPLLGERGCVAIFAPQKGADAADREQLEAALTHYSGLVTRATGRDDTTLPGAGAAGGVGYAALAVLRATMRPGIDLLLDLTGFRDLLPGAALVITGEGSLDEQTLLGKAPAGVAQAAGEAGVPVVAVCGRSLLPPEAAQQAGIRAVYALSDLEPDQGASMAQAAPLLRRLTAQMAAEQL